MEKQKGNKFYPKLDRCFTFQSASSMIGIVSLITFICTDAPIYALLASCALIMLGLFFLVVSMLGWNSAIYFYDDRVEQTRFGKRYVWYFEEMIDCKLRGGGPCGYGAYMPQLTVITCSDLEKSLEIEIKSKCFNKLLEKTKTFPINKKIGELMSEQ